MTQDYRVEFPDFPPADMPAIPAGFEDWSWHNDTCPSFAKPAIGMQVYIDFKDEGMREMPGHHRFCIFPISPDGVLLHDEATFSTDDWNVVLHRIADAESELARQVAP